MSKVSRNYFEVSRSPFPISPKYIGDLGRGKSTWLTIVDRKTTMSEGRRIPSAEIQDDGESGNCYVLAMLFTHMEEKQRKYLGAPMRSSGWWVGGGAE